MTEEEIIDCLKTTGLNEEFVVEFYEEMELFAKLVAKKERGALEVELLKLKQGVASKSDYIQGRWDLIGEFQDIIRARSKT